MALPLPLPALSSWPQFRPEPPAEKGLSLSCGSPLPVPLCPGLGPGQLAYVNEARKGASQGPGGQQPGWAGFAKPSALSLPSGSAGPGQGRCWKGRWAVAGLARSWLPGQKSLSQPLKTCPLWAKERAAGGRPLRGFSQWGAVWPCPRPYPSLYPLLSALSPGLVLVTCLKVGSGCPPVSGQTPRHSNFHSFCINPAGWCLRSPIPFSFSFLVVFFLFFFLSFLPFIFFF